MFFTTRGHLVYRVSSAESADLRRYLSKHAKTNGIDADTLARLPLFDPAGLQPLELPGPQRAALDRRVRALTGYPTRCRFTPPLREMDFHDTDGARRVVRFPSRL